MLNSVVVFPRNSVTTETQRTQRLHREEFRHDFSCKAPFIAYPANLNLSFNKFRHFIGGGLCFVICGDPWICFASWKWVSLLSRYTVNELC